MQMPELMGNEHILLHYPHTLLVHIILQKNAFSSESKVLTVFLCHKTFKIQNLKSLLRLWVIS